MFVATGDIGRKIAAARETIMSQGDLADALKVSQSRLSGWERGKHDPKPEYVRRACEILNIPIEYFYENVPEVVRERQTPVYNKSVDSGPDERLINAVRTAADERAIRAAVTIGDGARIWSAKGARRDFLQLLAFVVEGKTVIQISDLSLSPRFRTGTILSFKPSSFPALGIMLLLTSKKDPDLQTIRYIDPNGKADELLPAEPGLRAETLQDWDVKGFAFAEGWPAGGVYEFNIRPAGVLWARS